MLTDDGYDGVTYYYSTVGFDERDGQAYLNFEYHIVDNPDELELDGNPEFGNYIGDILVEIIEEGLAAHESNGENDTVSSTE